MQNYYLPNPVQGSSGALFPERITRSACLVRFVLLFAGTFLAGCLMAHADHVSLPQIILLSGAACMFLFLGLAFFRSILIPRVRDMGLSALWVLLIFVPHLHFLFVLALLLVPTNAFAPKPFYVG